MRTPVFFIMAAVCLSACGKPDASTSVETGVERSSAATPTPMRLKKQPEGRAIVTYPPGTHDAEAGITLPPRPKSDSDS